MANQVHEVMRYVSQARSRNTDNQLTCGEDIGINTNSGTSREVLIRQTSRSAVRPEHSVRSTWPKVYIISKYDTRSVHTLTRYSCQVGTSGRPDFIKVQFESSCWEAWRK